MTALIRSLLVILFVAAVVRGEALVVNGDFETDSLDAPPPGWAMWGDDVWKNPQHFRRDTENPHQGKASLRIDHPRNSGGYIVTHPAHAIRSEPNTTYDITFAARSNAKGTSVVGVGAYQSIDPYVDAPPPIMRPIEVSTEWQTYRLRIREGVEFDANVARLLMLTFKATAKFEEERTLWIDDVQVTATPNSPDLPRLVSLQRVNYTPVNPVLKPGDTLDVTIDATRSLRPATTRALGISFHRVCGHPQVPYHPDGTYTLKKETEAQIASLNVPLTRFYGVGDEKLGVNWAIDRVAELCKMAGIPQRNCVIELESQYADTKLTPQQWADAVKYSVSKGYTFCHWEVGNEVYAAIWGGGKAFPDADDYVNHLKAVSAAIKAVQPEARIGASLRHDHMTWGSYVLAQAAGSYDFVCPHLYALDPPGGKTFEDLTLVQNTRILDEVARLRALVAHYNPDKRVAIIDTEWGQHMPGPNDTAADFQPKNANILGTMHRAVRLIYYVREPLVDGASAWGMIGRSTEPGFPTIYVDAPEKRSMFYWLYHHFGRHVGSQVLPITGTAPFHGDAGPLTPMVATRSEDGQAIHIIIANASWDRPVDARMPVIGFNIRSLEAVALTQDDQDASPVLPDATDPVRKIDITNDGGAITFRVPPHSIVFVTARTE